MARKALVEVIGDATSFARSLKESAAGADHFQRQLRGLSVDVKKSAETQVQASVRKDARLRQEIAAYKQVASEAKRGSREQIAASNMAARGQARLAHSMGVTEHESQKLSAASSKAGREFSHLGRGALAGSGAVRGLGRSLAFASAGFLSAAGAVSLLRSASSAASDLTEEMNKANVVFRGSQGQVAAWSANLNAAFGMTRAEALHTAATFGNMLVPMGFARSDAAKMSESLVNLAGDMASFNNASPQDTLAALQSGLAGQVRPLRQFGVFLTQDRIKAEAFADGIAKTNVNVGKVADANTKVAIAQAKLTAANAKYGAGTTQVASATLALHTAQTGLAKALAGSTGTLTNAQKAAAIYRIVMKDTADAQGDAARTSGALAGQLRKEHAEVGNLKERIGAELLPAEIRVLKAGNDWLAQSKNQERVQRDVHKAVQDLGVAVGVMRDLIAKATPVISGITKAFGGLKHTLELLAATIAGIKFLHILDGIGGIASQSRIASGEVSVLRGRLLALRTIGVIGVTVAVGFEVAKGAEKFSKYLGGTGLGKAIGAGDSQFSAENVATLVKAGSIDKAKLDMLKRNGMVSDAAYKAGLAQMTGMGTPSFGGTGAVDQLKGAAVGDAITSPITDTLAKVQAFLDRQPTAAGGTTPSASTPTAGGGSAGGLTVGKAPKKGPSAASLAAKAQRAYEASVRTRLLNLKTALSASRAGTAARHRAESDLLVALNAEVVDARLSALKRAGYRAALISEMNKEGTEADKAAKAVQKAAAKAAKARVAKIQSAQFSALGLGAKGTGQNPFKETLKHELGRVNAELKGTLLDTNKNTHLLTQVGKVLEGQFGVITDKSRAAIRRLLDTLSGELKKVPRIMAHAATAEQLTAGIPGLAPAARKVLEQRIAQAQAHSGHVPDEIGVQGVGVKTVSHVTNVHLDGKVIATVVSNHQEKAARHRAVQTSGINAGRYHL